MSERPDPSLLESLFPPKVVEAEEIDGIPPELFDYKNQFGGKSWPDVKRKHYEVNTDAFSLMAHQTLKYFIAGFLEVILTDPDSMAAEFLVYFAGQKSFAGFCRVLDQAQIDYLISVIDWLIMDDYFSTNDRERYARSRDTVMKY